MKPIASTMTEIDNLPGEEVKFSISTENAAWVMRSMADLYSNRELACVREYSTNAYDANLARALRDGTEVEPIQVTLPSAINPYFTVKDNGIGMSEKELKEVYTMFGESTKRVSDDFNGMLGFGSKSAIAYTNTFTVTAIQNGHKTVAVITRREDAMGGYVVTLKVILTVETKESDGVEVQIPVHNWREFSQKATDFYRFWEPGRVLVNGRQPERAVGEKIDDNLYYYNNSGYGNNSYVVMGNVPYRVTNADALFPHGMNKISFVAYVPVGTVEFTPSREDLKYSEHTKTNLHKIISDFVEKSVKNAKKEIADAKTHYEAYDAWVKWSNLLGPNQVSSLTFKGEPLVHQFNITGRRYDPQAYRYSTSAVTHYRVSNSRETVFVVNFPMELSTAHRRKIKEWAAFKGLSPRYYLFTPDTKIDSPWVDPKRVVDWETVKAETPKAARKPRAASVPSGRKAGTFDLISVGGRSYEQDVPSTKPLYYIMVKDLRDHSYLDIQWMMRTVGITTDVVIMPANRLGKFQRFYPHGINLMDHIRSAVVLDGPSLLDATAKRLLSISHDDTSRLSRLDASKVDDPDIKSLALLLKKGVEFYTEKYEGHKRIARALGMEFKRHQWEYYHSRTAEPLSKSYPLVASVGYSKYDDHLYFYMNNLYAARKAGKTTL